VRVHACRRMRACVCVRARVRARVCVRACVRGCVRVRVYGYEYTVHYKVCRSHGNADGLSRLPLPVTVKEVPCRRTRLIVRRTGLFIYEHSSDQSLH